MESDLHEPMLTASPPVVGKPLGIKLRRGDGTELVRASVRRGHLSAVAADAWMQTCLRRGLADVALADLSFALRLRGTEPCRIELEVRCPDGRSLRLPLELDALAGLARQTAADQCIATGLLNEDDLYSYSFCRDELGASAAADVLRLDHPFTYGVRMAPLHFVRVPLTSLLKDAKPLGSPNGEFPVIYSAKSWASAERMARRGETLQVECGAALIGSLLSDVQSGECGVMVTDALEVEAEKQTIASLEYSSQTLTAINVILKARCSARPHLCERFIGQVHSHPFAPGIRCDECDKRPSCPLTSAVASNQDESWTRAMFTRQPWAVGHIFGFNARKEPDNQLYSSKLGVLRPRGFYVVDAELHDFIKST